MARQSAVLRASSLSKPIHGPLVRQGRVGGAGEARWGVKAGALTGGKGEDIPFVREEWWWKRGGGVSRLSALREALYLAKHLAICSVTSIHLALRLRPARKRSPFCLRSHTL